MLLRTSCRRLANVRPTTMPLRARITNPAMMATPIRRITSTSPLPNDERDDVLFDSQYGLRTIKLNRPKKLNSLNGSMCRKIIPRLQEWSKSDMANMIVLKGEGRALCAGGDVAYLALKNKEGAEGQQESKDYFALEYKLDHLIATYSKPYIAFMDGITMGGGVGLSLHAPFRIATENTVFAMPETTIGFFPDVGASFFLPRLDGGLGMYCALTSDQLKGASVFYAGIATHYLHSSSLPDLEARLGELRFKDHDNLRHRLQVINTTIEEFTTGVPEDQSPSKTVVGGNIRAAIDYVFQPSHNLDRMLSTLQDYANGQSKGVPPDVMEWAGKTRKTILQRSPTSVKVTLRLLREGNSWNIAETFQKEHNIASRFMEHPDFVEGVSALLIDKPKRSPSWSPASLEQVSEADVETFFSGTPQLELLNTSSHASYRNYPHAWIGLPQEASVQKAVQSSKYTTVDQVVDSFVKESQGKQGVKQKVEEILDRRTTEDNGRLVWA